MGTLDGVLLWSSVCQALEGPASLLFICRCCRVGREAEVLCSATTITVGSGLYLHELWLCFTRGLGISPRLRVLIRGQGSKCARGWPHSGPENKAKATLTGCRSLNRATGLCWCLMLPHCLLGLAVALARKF